MSTSTPSVPSPSAAANRKRRILDALEEIELCLWEHLFLSSDAPATMEIFNTVEMRLRELKEKIDKNGAHKL